MNKVQLLYVYKNVVPMVCTRYRYRHTCNIPTVNNKQNKVRFIFMIMIYMRLLFYDEIIILCNE